MIGRALEHYFTIFASITDSRDLTQLHPDALFRLAPAFIPEMPSLQHGALGENALLTPRILCTLIAFVLRGASSVCQARTLCSLVRRFVLHHGWCGPLGAQVLVLTVNVAVVIQLFEFAFTQRGPPFPPDLRFTRFLPIFLVLRTLSGPVLVPSCSRLTNRPHALFRASFEDEPPRNILVDALQAPVLCRNL